MTKRKTIKKWYMETYPSDDLGKEITPGVTFEDCFITLLTGNDIYKKIGVGDSVIRERVFEGLTKVFKRSYGYFYNLWLEPPHQVLSDDDDDLPF